MNELRKVNNKQKSHNEAPRTIIGLRSNSGHLYILRLNFDFNDHKEFVGQMNVYHEGSCLSDIQ